MLQRLSACNRVGKTSHGMSETGARQFRFAVCGRYMRKLVFRGFSIPAWQQKP